MKFIIVIDKTKITLKKLLKSLVYLQIMVQSNDSNAEENKIIIKDCFNINIASKLITLNIYIFKQLSFINYSVLTDITAVDLLNTKLKYNNNTSNYNSPQDRFSVIYILQTVLYSSYIIISTGLKVNSTDVYKIESVSNIYLSANWAEREVWEMFGIHFNNHKDLRRLLSDYHFSGYPLRKDFPLTGYKELRYDDSLNSIVSEPVNLSQKFRSFTFSKPWLLR